MESVADLIRQGEIFFAGLVEELQRLGFSRHELRPDHLCFRVATPEEYVAYKKLFTDAGRLLAESPINGRFICTFELRDPFRTSLGDIRLLELPAPKASAPYPTGFEHGEFVVSTSFKTLQDRKPALTFKANKPKPFNAELELATNKGKAKFHHIPLDRVIEIEETPVTDVVFDFDGTIIDAKSQIVEINRKVFSEVLKRDVSHQEATSFFSATFKGLFENFGIRDPNEQNRAMKLWSHHSKSQSFALLEGTNELIRDLAQRGLTLHIWTARDLDSTQAILKSHGLGIFFETLNCATAFSSKPDRDSFDTYNPADNSKNYLMLGDSFADMAGAKNIRGIAGAAIWDPHASEDALAGAGAELFFRHPREVAEWLTQQKALQTRPRG